ncbi:UNVERIFIED_CONTAM: hypothetical protein RMT77_016827 [Armadillidium vulgare]
MKLLGLLGQFIFTSFLIIITIKLSDCAPNCNRIPYDAPLNCIYGTKRDWCHRLVCAKGPGETCGGARMLNGLCGEGMFCSCGRCTGCANYNLKCYSGKIC